MPETKREANLWVYVGKISAVLAVIWVGIQIFNFFVPKDGYKLIAEGSHKYFELPKTDSEGKVLLDAGKMFQMWSFVIKNTGNKPLENLTLELPLKGEYKIIYSEDNVVYGDFINKVEIGELSPSYEINVICWKNERFISQYYAKKEEAKTKITHKYGWVSIKYPSLTRDLWACFKEYFAIILIFIVLAAVLFWYIRNFYNNSNKIKLDIKKDEQNNSVKSNNGEKK